MKIDDLSPAMQAQLEAVLQSVILWGTRLVAPQLLALDWLIAHQLELGLPARMRRVYAKVMADLDKHKTDRAASMVDALKQDGVKFPAVSFDLGHSDPGDIKPECTPASRAPFDTDRMRRVHARVMESAADSENPLDNPTMDGIVWMCPTPEEAAAWGHRPWEIRDFFDSTTTARRLPADWSRNHAIYRPLRLPGQDPVTGIVKGPDMTPGHFERLPVTGWNFRSWRVPEWHRASAENDCTGVGQEWRPVGWPEPTSEAPPSDRTV